MRKQFVQTLQNILYTDNKTVLMLGDISVYGFRNEITNLSQRVYNIGILEQCTVGVAAGLANIGLIPFVHTIAPFLVERTFEQLKVDFGYQKLNGNFISVGASYDYAALGCTHHCPGDVGILSNIPNMQIVTPGTSEEFNKLLLESYNNGFPTYYRLCETENSTSQNVSFGKGNIIKTGTDATVICFGNMLDAVYESCKHKNVTLLYYTTVLPFDTDLLYQHFNKKIIVCEPYYAGSVNHVITQLFTDKIYTLYNIGIPRQFLTNYGSKKEHDAHLGLDLVGIDNKINKWLAL